MTADWVTDIAKELIREYPTIEYIHSDQGSQYTFKVYLKYLLTNGVAPSFSSKGYPYHKASYTRFWTLPHHLSSILTRLFQGIPGFTIDKKKKGITLLQVTLLFI